MAIRLISVQYRIRVIKVKDKVRRRQFYDRVKERQEHASIEAESSKEDDGPFKKINWRIHSSIFAKKYPDDQNVSEAQFWFESSGSGEIHTYLQRKAGLLKLLVSRRN